MSDPFDFDKKPDEYGVMGNPIAHSKSPLIHATFAKQTRQRIRYNAILVDLGGFPQAVGNFQANGGKGVNVTVPFKTDAWRLADEMSERAKLAGAVNTLVFRDNNMIFGDNTDGIGLLRDLQQNHHIKLEGKRVLMLGAGGAARGACLPLLEAKPAKLMIANRSVERAINLAEMFSEYGPIEGCSYQELAGKQFDIVINATSASLQGELPPLPDNLLTEGSACYDMMYGAEPTTFLQWAAQHGCDKRIDGLGMLVEQAAESFALWRSVQPETQEIIDEMRRAMQG